MSQEEKIETNRLLKYGFLVILAAIVLNSAVYLFFNLFGIFSDDVLNPNTNEPIPMTEIVIQSIFQMVIGLLGFALASEVFKRPIRIFRVMATVFLVMSFYLPFTIKNVTISVIIALELMHLISGVLMIRVLPRLVVSNQEGIEKKMETDT
ncbi:MAG: DUF3021 domain-containing protein [Candidatus Heimdallarchaeota archaeon]|nr:DUF3021 domain-containing protein [Candidatus Heimdallarchaeota archaeon]